MTYPAVLRNAFRAYLVKDYDELALESVTRVYAIQAKGVGGTEGVEEGELTR